MHMQQVQPGGVRNGFKINRLIGTGQYGAVYLVEKFEKIYAMKVMWELQQGRADLVNDSLIARDEMSRLRSVRHPFIIEYFEHFRLFDGPETYIIMEFCMGVNMKTAIDFTIRQHGTFSTENIEIILVQLLMAVAHLHTKNIVHREIKPNNIFMLDDYKRVKLGDFGFVKPLNQNASVTLSSCRRERESYRAPELWQGIQLSCKVDEWSLGCIVYELMRLRPPFGKNNFSNIINAVYEPVPLISRMDGNNSALISVMNRLLTANPDERPHAATILEWPIFDAAKVVVREMLSEHMADIPSPGIPEESESDFSDLVIDNVPQDLPESQDVICKNLSVLFMWNDMVDGFGGTLAFKPCALPPECGGRNVQIWLMRRTPLWGNHVVKKPDMRLFVQTVDQPPNTRLMRLRFNLRIYFYKTNDQISEFFKCGDDSLDTISKGTVELLYIEHKFNWDELDRERPPMANVSVTYEWLHPL